MRQCTSRLLSVALTPRRTHYAEHRNIPRQYMEFKHCQQLQPKSASGTFSNIFDNAYCSIKHIMLSIFRVASPTIVVYRLLFLGLYCLSLTVCFCFCFQFFETLVKCFFEKSTRAEFTMTPESVQL